MTTASTAAQGAVAGLVTTDANGTIGSDGGALQTQVNTVQGTANTALTNAATAQGTANTAVTAAATAQTTANGALQRTGGTMTGAINMGGNAITNLAAPVAAGDAANKGYVDTQFASINAGSANLQSQINSLGAEDKKLASGIAISLALAQPMLLNGQSFAFRVGYGTFDNANAAGISASGLIARNFVGAGSTAVLDGGVGFGTDSGQVAGRAGVTIGF